MSSTKIFVIGVGGQGTLATSKIIGQAALRSEINVIMGEVHGMSQRGGVVESTILLGDAHSPLIADGDADILLGFEPAETLRALRKASNKTTIITNLRPIVPISVSLGQSSYPDLDAVLDALRGRCRRLLTLQATDIAKESGSTLATNMVMLGALAACGELPFSADLMKTIIEELLPPRFAAINLRAFERGYETIARAAAA